MPRGVLQGSHRGAEHPKHDGAVRTSGMKALNNKRLPVLAVAAAALAAVLCAGRFWPGKCE